MALADTIATSRTAIQAIVQEATQLDTELAAIQQALGAIPAAVTSLQAASTALQQNGVAASSDVITKIAAIVSGAQGI